MSAKMRLTMTSMTVLFVFILSAVLTVPALADDETPPAPDAPIVTEPEDASTAPVPADETEPASLPDPEPAPAEEAQSTPAKETPADEELLSDLPEGTEVVVLDENGETVPLVTQEAAEIIVEGDPVWCPASMAVPTPGAGGCTIAYSSMAALITELTTVGGLVTDPAVDGVIWIASNYNLAMDNASLTLDGGSVSLVNMDAFKLTLKGGWCDGSDPLCIGLIDTSKPSTFDVRLNIINWNNDVTLSDIVITAAPGGDGLTVATTKNIVLTRVTSQSNPAGRGANLNNTASGAGTGNVTITNGTFSLNGGAGGLLVQSNGAITLTSVTATGNTAGYGANLVNSGATTAKNVTITGGTFNSNAAGGTGGLVVTSNGAITLTNVTASSNTNYGANLNNSGAPTVQKVTVTGGTFNTNGANGLQVMSLGNITLATIIANGNTGQGASVDNRVGGLGTGSTVITDSQFNTNASTGGLLVLSNGTITLTSVKANGNTGGYGASIDNSAASSAKNVSLLGVNEFNDNRSNGLVVASKGAISVKDITASANGIPNLSGSGAVLNNTYGANPGPGVTLTGLNIFTDNYTHGLTVDSNGPVKLNNVIANANGTTYGYGLWVINNLAATAQPVMLTGTSQFKYNYSGGLIVDSQGAITLNNITANGNTNGNGAYLDNTNSFSAAVTLTGTNYFNSNYYHGLYVQSLGAISVSNVTADDNGQSGTVGYGALLDNSAASTFQKVTVSGINSFNNNRWTGLLISSKGAISVSSVTSTGSQTGYGVSLDNTAGSLTNSKQPVTLAGTNFINNNYGYGLYLTSYGAVTLNNLTADENGLVGGFGYGAFVGNDSADTPMAVTINGVNTFNGNYYHGLLVNSKGAIKASNLTANQNGILGSFGSGVELNNTFGGAAGSSLTLSGVNFFNDNYSTGLGASSSGVISLSNVTAKDNTHGYGLYVQNQSSGTASPKDITIAGTNVLNGNYYDGVAAFSYGNIVLNNITATGNGTNLSPSNGADLNNAGDLLTKGITLKGTNLFSDNFLLGLNVASKGAITVNNVTATGNGTGGAWLQNDYPSAVAGVNLTGVNFFNLNDERGLTVYTFGAITASSLNASGNLTFGGVQLNNYNAVTPQKVTLTGASFFGSNTGYGLQIISKGAVSLSSISAVGNLGSDGVTVNNTLGLDTLPQAVTLTGTNAFTGNGLNGLTVYSYGAISLASVTANDNGQSGSGYGAYLDNCQWNGISCNGSGNLTLSGVNTFNDNSSSGLFVQTKGAITSATKITASDNGSYGASLSNSVPGGVGGITLAGINTMNGNFYTGLSANSYGAITMNNVTASGNGTSGTFGYGADLENVSAATPMNVTLTGTNTFSGNNNTGLTVATMGAFKANNLTASSNIDGGGAAIDNFNGSSDSATSPGVTLTGKNAFDNNQSNGLQIMSHGAITLNSVSASGNGNAGFGSGVNMYNVNLVAPRNITLSGTNTFNDNTHSGLYISGSTGAITASNITASGNVTGYGAFMDNTPGTLGVTLSGVNTFNENANIGLDIQTDGNVSMTKVTADDNASDGLNVMAGGSVTLTCGSFTNNGGWGVDVYTPLTLTLKGVVSSGNIAGNVNVGGGGTLVIVRTCPLP